MKLARTIKPFFIFDLTRYLMAFAFLYIHSCLQIGFMKCTGLCLLALELTLLSRIFDVDGLHSKPLQSRKEEVGVAKDDRGPPLCRAAQKPPNSRRDCCFRDLAFCRCNPKW
jgi:hypothetical protein